MIEVVKRTGANLIETVDGVKAAMAQVRKAWPENVEVSFTQDKSKTIRDMLHELQNRLDEERAEHRQAEKVWETRYHA